MLLFLYFLVKRASYEVSSIKNIIYTFIQQKKRTLHILIYYYILLLPRNATHEEAILTNNKKNMIKESMKKII